MTDRDFDIWWYSNWRLFQKSGLDVKQAVKQAWKESAKLERETCIETLERLIAGDGICAENEVWIHDCTAALRKRDQL